MGRGDAGVNRSFVFVPACVSRGWGSCFAFAGVTLRRVQCQNQTEKEMFEKLNIA